MSGERFAPDEDAARQLDADDPLGGWRERFHVPRLPDGREAVYFAGNSLGLQPRTAATAVQRELERWAAKGVEGHFDGEDGWYAYHRLLRESSARVVGAEPREVVAMNGLTVNLHLLLLSFYRPRAGRHKVLMEDCAFPSDTFAVQSQVRRHGYDPREAIVVARSRDEGARVPPEEVDAILERHGEEIALVLLGGVNYFTGQVFDMQAVTERAHERGCVVGLDLAHAAGNVPLALHAWGVDFAVWCTYKYLNAGPGSIAGAFVHARHAERTDLPRLAGWWGHDPERRFRMHLETEFRPIPGAEGWQLGNPPILAMAPARASLEHFDEVGMGALRSKSRRLTAYLEWWIDRAGEGRVEVRTPRDPEERGCQLSLRATERPHELFDVLRAAGVVGDFREPDVVRVAPVPFYNSFHDVWRFGRVLEGWARAR